MKQKKRSGESTALLAALLTAQWLGSAGSGLIPAAGNAAYLSILLAGTGLALLCTSLRYALPQENLPDICKGDPVLRWFPLSAALLLLLLSATALRDTLDMLALTLLPQTPRWFALLLLLPAVFFMGKGSAVGVMRTISLLAPVLVGLYALVLLLSGWKQFNLYGLFPLLGTGLRGIGKAAGSALTAGAWLVLLPLMQSPAKESRGGMRACIWGTVLTAAGYLCCAMLPDSASWAATSYPLHEMSLSGGISFAFERMQALFVFAWLPVQTAAAAVGLAQATQCVCAVLPTQKTIHILPLLLTAAALLAFPDPQRSPAWLTAVLQTNTQCLLLLPLLIPLGIGKLREYRRAKEGKHHG